jgi:2-polyprenyl-6-methoxyphenol hydroxylase-like FAD-dependent oxidoreductase
MQTGCCIVGGGPAGVMLGYLLARAGVEVVVLEKHADFFRDFRGDTIHPSTLDLMAELGLLDAFLTLPHTEAHELYGHVGDHTVKIADFDSLPTRCKFIAFMPQWDFLNFLAEQGRAFPTFRLMLRSDGTDLIYRDGTVIGVRATTPDGPIEIMADLVVAADGRHSTIRERAGLQVDEFGVPIDVLWYRLPKHGQSDDHSLGYLRGRQMVVTIDRGDYWQTATLIPKGTYPEIQQEGLDAFRERVRNVAPPLRGAIDQLTSWDQVNLLSVQVNRLPRWYRPGLLCIGDAAHAMSPAFGVGVNYAIQDAVATANLLAEPLRAHHVTEAELAAVQARRERPTRRMQDVQVFLHRRLYSGVDPETLFAAPEPVRVLARLLAPLLTWRMARLVGLGFKPEHIATLG